MTLLGTNRDTGFDIQHLFPGKVFHRFCTNLAVFDRWERQRGPGALLPVKYVQGRGRGMTHEGKRNGRDENEHAKEMQADHHLHKDR